VLLSYRGVETGGAPNLSLDSGAVRFLYLPLWFSRLHTNDLEYNVAGDGPGADWTSLVEFGCSSASNTNGHFAIGMDGAGTNLIVRSRGASGQFVTNLSLPVRLTSLDDRSTQPRITFWHEVMVSWGTNGTTAYFAGNPSTYSSGVCANGSALACTASAAASGQAWSIASEADGGRAGCGLIDRFETFNFHAALTTNSWVLTASNTVDPPSITLHWAAETNAITYPGLECWRRQSPPGAPGPPDQWPRGDH
jgi:hypothetical protein